MAYDLNVAKVALFDVPDRPGVARAIFKALADANIKVDMIVQAAMRDERNDIAFTITKDDLPRALPVVERVCREIGASGTACGEARPRFHRRLGMMSNPGWRHHVCHPG